MWEVPSGEILLALLTSLVNNQSNIPRSTRFALLTNILCCMPERFSVSARGHSPMSVINKTINIFCAAIFAAVLLPSAAFAVDPWAGQDKDSDVYMDQMYKKKARWVGSHDDAIKRSKADEERQMVDGPVNADHDLPVKLDDSPSLREKTDPDKAPTDVVAKGFILPDGRYMWQGGGAPRIGVVPNPTLAMPGYKSDFNAADSGSTGILSPMLGMIDPSHTLRNTQITNWEQAAIAAGRVQAQSEMRADPKNWKEGMRAAQEAKQSSTADNQAAMSERNDATSYQYTAFIPLINIANEDAWQPCAADAPFKKYENAAWMVGKMYKEVYIPMAILFLLPGAVMTQVKVIVRTGFMFGGNDEDQASPFSGIMRAVIAVFLIPATQLFVSYTIDVGNSLTFEVTQFKLDGAKALDLDRIYDWKRKQTYNVDPKNKMNHVRNIKDAQHQGKMKLDPEGKTKFENQHFVTSTGQQWFNTLNSLLSQGMVCLNAFQFVMIEYLFLLGPIAAALFAWPGVAGDAFKKVFANWMNGVVLVTLWKFWWSIILLAMSIRLYLVNQDGGIPSADDPYEMFMAAAFGAMLMYIPFNPFDFRPGDLVSSVLEKAQQNVSKGGGGAASVGSAGSAGGGGGSGGGQNTGVSGGVG
jgi:hypothetical protein